MTAGQRRPLLLAVLVAVAGGLLLAGGAAGQWVTESETREVGGVEVEEETTVSGVEYAARAIPVGFGAALGGVLLAATRGRLRQVVAAGLAATGVGGVAIVALGIARAATAPGVLGPAPGLAVTGGLAVVGAAVLAARRPHGPVLGGSYDVSPGSGDGQDAPPTAADRPGADRPADGGEREIDEWGMASADREDAP